MSRGQVESVLGPVQSGALGRIDYHEHLFQVSPLLVGDELDDEASSGSEAGELKHSGFATMVDATPIGLGRRPTALARISEAVGLRIVATTGAHREPHYRGGHWLLELGVDELTELFCRDIEAGMPKSDGPRPGPTAVRLADEPVRAGIVKAGIGYWSISSFERRVLAAVAACWHRTEVPIMVHLEHGSAAFEVLAELGQHGVPAEAVALAHIDRNPDPGLHTELAQAGAYLGYDSFARTIRWPDSTLVDTLLRTVACGGGARVLLGGDVARRTRYRAYGGLPGLAYLGHRVLPRLEREGSAELVRAICKTNPARWLTGSASDDAIYIGGVDATSESQLG
jgi:5-phospho-D-xylono-1,4-lactonase